MKIKQVSIYVIACLMIFILVKPAFAQEPGEKLAKLFTQLTAQDVNLVATLEPPKTTYEIENWLAEISSEFNKNTEGLKFSYSYSDVQWKPEISCGKFSPVLRRDVTIWNHPNGTNKDSCPHDATSYHPGTISAKATFAGSLRKDSGDNSETLLTMKWSADCVYKDGSKEGRAPCIVKFLSAEGPYASYVAGENPNPTQSTPTASTSKPKPKDKSFNLLSFLGISIVILAGGVGVYIFAKKKA